MIVDLDLSDVVQIEGEVDDVEFFYIGGGIIGLGNEDIVLINVVVFIVDVNSIDGVIMG